MKRLLALLFSILTLAALASTAYADDFSQTVSVNVSVSGNNLLGTAVGRYSANPTAALPVPINVTWTFTGQLNGKPASASGTWAGVWDGKAYKGNITSFTSWEGFCVNAITIAGRTVYGPNTCIGAPGTPMQYDVTPGSIWITLGLHKLGQVSLPLALQGWDESKGKVPGPFAGNLVLGVTNVAGRDAVTGLPRTGEQPWWVNAGVLTSFVLGLAALLVSHRVIRRRRAIRCAS